MKTLFFFENLIKELGTEAALNRAKEILRDAPEQAERVVMGSSINSKYLKKTKNNNVMYYNTHMSRFILNKNYVNEFSWSSPVTYELSEIKGFIAAIDTVITLGGLGKSMFYMTGMKLNKCDSVKCPRTGIIVSKANLEKYLKYFKAVFPDGIDQ